MVLMVTNVVSLDQLQRNYNFDPDWLRHAFEHGTHLSDAKKIATIDNCLQILATVRPYSVHVISSRLVQHA